MIMSKITFCIIERYGVHRRTYERVGGTQGCREIFILTDSQSRDIDRVIDGLTVKDLPPTTSSEIKNDLERLQTTNRILENEVVRAEKSAFDITKLKDEKIEYITKSKDEKIEDIIKTKDDIIKSKDDDIERITKTNDIVIKSKDDIIKIKDDVIKCKDQVIENQKESLS